MNSSGPPIEVPQAVRDAATDPRLKPRDLAVLVTIYCELDPIDYRPIKNRWLANRVGMSPRNVIRALDRLTTYRYLRRRARPGDLTTYRMVFSTLPREAQRKQPRGRPTT